MKQEEIKNKSTGQKLGILFITTFLISATTNGGYAIAASLKSKFVEKYGWISEEEMMDLISLAQSAPGPIAVNTSVVVGYRLCGMPGALTAMFGTILPPFIIMTLVTLFYNLVADNSYVKLLMKGMQAGVAALLVSIFCDMFVNVKNHKSILEFALAAIAFVFVRFTDFSIFYLAVFCGLAGFIKAKMLSKKEDKK